MTVGQFNPRHQLPQKFKGSVEQWNILRAGWCGTAKRCWRPEELLAEERALTALAARGLRQLPGVEVFTGPGQSGVLSFRCRDLDCEEAAACLAEAGIAVRAGLHCAPMAHRSGGTLETGTVRVSFSAFNTSAEVRQFLQVCRTAFLPG